MARREVSETVYPAPRKMTIEHPSVPLCFLSVGRDRARPGTATASVLGRCRCRRRRCPALCFDHAARYRFVRYDVSLELGPVGPHRLLLEAGFLDRGTQFRHFGFLSLARLPDLNDDEALLSRGRRM